MKFTGYQKVLDKRKLIVILENKDTELYDNLELQEDDLNLIKTNDIFAAFVVIP